MRMLYVHAVTTARITKCLLGLKLRLASIDGHGKRRRPVQYLLVYPEKVP